MKGKVLAMQRRNTQTNLPNNAMTERLQKFLERRAKSCLHFFDSINEQFDKDSDHSSSRSSSQSLENFRPSFDDDIHVEIHEDTEDDSPKQQNDESSIDESSALSSLDQQRHFSHYVASSQDGIPMSEIIMKMFDNDDIEGIIPPRFLKAEYPDAIMDNIRKEHNSGFLSFTLSSRRSSVDREASILDVNFVKRVSRNIRVSTATVSRSSFASCQSESFSLDVTESLPCQANRLSAQGSAASGIDEDSRTSPVNNAERSNEIFSPSNRRHRKIGVVRSRDSVLQWLANRSGSYRDSLCSVPEDKLSVSGSEASGVESYYHSQYHHPYYSLTHDPCQKSEQLREPSKLEDSDKFNNGDINVTTKILLKKQFPLNAGNSFKFVEDICPQVSFKSKKSKASIGYIIMLVAKQLILLNLSGCNITDQGADMIAAVLLEIVSLKNIDLSNAMLNSIKAIKISDALKKISSLEVFNISSNDIDDRATDSIAAIMSSNSLMEKANLSNNKLSYIGVLKIANALSKNIKVFDISRNSIACDDITVLASVLSKLPLLQELNISQTLLTLTNVLTIAQYFRQHPTLQTLDLSSNPITFSSACEFIMDVILSVNQTLINLNVCGRNIRPRHMDDYPFPSNEENNLRENNIVDTQTVFIKVTEICPISYDKDVISYQVNCHGGVFYNQDYNFAIVVPPGAVSRGECVEIQATTNWFGPYIIPKGFYPISSFYWVSANYEFRVPVYLLMNHYAKIRSLDDINNLHVLQSSACQYDSNDSCLVMNTFLDGDKVYFDYGTGYCVLATNHFCSFCQAKSVKHIPEYLLACYYTYNEPSSGSLIAEVCFCPSNSDCRKVVVNQCKQRNTEFQHSILFDITDGEELYISSIDFSSINGNEWKLYKSGKLNIIHLRDFEYWRIFYGLSVEEITEREKCYEYPPRLQIECKQINSSKSLYSSFVVSKRSTNMHTKIEMPIAQFSLTVAQPDTNQPNVILPTPVEDRIFLLEPDMHDLNRILIHKVSHEWEEVAYALGYKISTVKFIRSKHREDPRKCCREVFEDWLTTSNGAKPKTWHTLLVKLKEIDSLDSITKEITEKLMQMDS